MAEAFRYLKWHDDVIGVVIDDWSVTFTEPRYNSTVSLYTHGASSWTPAQFAEFLAERIPSPSRRDIERILFRCGLSEYDIFKIADATHAVNAKDELWLAHAKSDRFEDALTDVFESIFLQRIDAQGDSVNTPEGFNVKRYGAFDGKYGIVKRRISPLTTDVESEIAAFLLAQEMGVPCCPARRFDDDSVFSEFMYDVTNEYVVHMRRLFDGQRGENELDNLLAVRPQYADDFCRMTAFDFVTRQDDRHLSNIAVKVTGNGESFYPLYDNGRSLFYEDTERMVADAVAEPAAFATTFGPTGTYWDHARDIAARGVRFGELVNLEIAPQRIRNILEKAGFTGYRLVGAQSWIEQTLEMLRRL